MRNVTLPNEILEMVMNYLDNDEVVICSAIDTRWYLTARRCLRNRTGFVLCRWPDLPTTQDARVCLAGYRIIKNFTGFKLKGLKRLKLMFDEPTQLKEEMLERIFSSCRHLESLELLNLSVIDRAQGELILEKCCPGLKLRIRLQGQTKTSTEAIEVLKDHRELLSEILIEYEKTKCLFAWCPNPSHQNEIVVRQTITSVTMDAPGLALINLQPLNSLKSLKLTNCYSLLEKELVKLSQLQLNTFHISDCQLKESEWLQALATGFKTIKEGSFINCHNLTDAVLKALSNKPLHRLNVDIRNGASEIHGIFHLRRLKTLTHFHVIAHQIVTNQLLDNVTNHWFNLVSLTVEESVFGYDPKFSTLHFLTNHLNTNSAIEFHHKMNHSKFGTKIIKTFELF